MMWFGEEAEARVKELEGLFGRLIVRIVDFQNDWDRSDPIWRFCWQDRKRRWYEAHLSYYNGRRKAFKAWNGQSEMTAAFEKVKLQIG